MTVVLHQRPHLRVGLRQTLAPAPPTLGLGLVPLLLGASAIPVSRLQYWAHMSQKPLLLPAWAQPLTVMVRIMVPRIQELDWPWDSRKAVTLSRRGVRPQIAKD